MTPRILLIDDDSPARLDGGRVPRPLRLRGRDRRLARRRPQQARGRPLRRPGARPDAARRRRPRPVPRAARRKPHPAPAAAHAHRARRADGPDRRPRARRRRLPAEAVRAARAAGPGQGAAAPGRAAAGRRRRAALRPPRDRPRRPRRPPRRQGLRPDRAPVRPPGGAGAKPRPGADARPDHGFAQGPSARGLRSLDRRPHLAHPGADRGRPEGAAPRPHRARRRLRVRPQAGRRGHVRQREEPLPPHLRHGGGGAAAVRLRLGLRGRAAHRPRAAAQRVGGQRAARGLGRPDPALPARRRCTRRSPGGGLARVVAAAALPARARRRERRAHRRLGLVHPAHGRGADQAVRGQARRRAHALDLSAGAAAAAGEQRAPRRSRAAGRRRPGRRCPTACRAAPAWRSSWWCCSSPSPPAPIRWCAG